MEMNRNSNTNCFSFILVFYNRKNMGELSSVMINKIKCNKHKEDTLDNETNRSNDACIELEIQIESCTINELEQLVAKVPSSNFFFKMNS